MSFFQPRDLSQTCAVHTNLTTCSASTFLFLQLVSNLLGGSPDAGGKSSAGGYGSDGNVGAFYGNLEQHFDVSWDDFFGENPQNGQSHQSGHHPNQDQNEYDFVVIGAGSAGCVVANRLTEIKEWKVLLLEAGGEEPEAADVPAFSPMLQGSNIDWGYSTQPSPKSCLARDQGRCNWARGKVMGGSSTINYMIYIRGHPRDYDEWEEMGNHGWSYRDVLPYFIKTEDNRNIDHPVIDKHYHGVGGYQTIEYFRYQDKNNFVILDAYKELGLEILDQTAEKLIGASLLQFHTRDGERLTSNGAFIRPIRRKRKNLTIQTNTHVTRILIDPKTKHAYGVEYINTKTFKRTRVIAKKEVILSAGSINSPIILMNSGIGPADHLQECGIKVLKDAAVGYNLHDHTTIDGVVFSLTNKTAINVDDEQRSSDVYTWIEKREGPLTGTGSIQANAFVQTKYEQSIDRPDIQYASDVTNVANFFTDPILAYDTNVLPTAYYDGIMLRPILLNPESRGRVLLNHSDPVFGQPLIYANTFTKEIDLLKMVEGVKQSLNLMYTKTFQHLGIRLVTTPLPACYHIPFGSDEYWACVAMSYTTTIFHPVGTCKMGPKQDESAVVDPELKVHGIHRLRVIDSSIMPKIPRGNTNAPTMMIGEKGSDYVKDTWLKNSKYSQTEGVSGNLNSGAFKNYEHFFASGFK